MKPSIYDILKDLFGWMGNSLRDLFGMLCDLRKSPIVARGFEDIKNGIKRLGGSVSSFFSDVFRPKGTGEAGSSSPRLGTVKYVVIGTALGCLIIFILFSAVFFQIGNRWDKRSYLINVPQGFGAAQVSDLLLEKGIIGSTYSFDMLVSMFGIQNRIQSGTYMFSPSMTAGSIVYKLKKGEVTGPPLERVVFPEGTSIYKMGQILKDDGVSNGDIFITLQKDPITPDLLSKFPFLSGIKNDSLEGYLFPDTYLVPQEVSPASLRDLMLSRFASVVMPFWDKAKIDTAMSLHEVLTLASIIEKEAAVDEERPLISSVFRNRLAKGMHLSADPTVKYALSDYRRPTKRVYFIDLQINSPYNTYKFAGLPPGPICSPGLSSIKAAIYPAKTTFLYFVARKDGTHVFSTTWQEHEKAKLMVRGE